MDDSPRIDSLRSLRQRWLSPHTEELRIAFEDERVFARDVRELLSLWPKVPPAFKQYFDVVAGLEGEDVDVWGESHRVRAVEQAWDFCRELAQAGGHVLPALEEHRQFFARQFETADRELRAAKRLREDLRQKEDPLSSIPATNEIRELKRRLAFARTDFNMKRHAVQVFTRRFAVSMQVPELTTEEAQSMAGRKSTLNDPGAYPAETLNAVLEWTGDDANRGRPFRSGSHNETLCGFVSETLADHAGYEISQETIKTRLRSLMDELNVELPHGPTNKHSYFEAREQIVEAMQERGLSVEL